MVRGLFQLGQAVAQLFAHILAGETVAEPANGLFAGRGRDGDRGGLVDLRQLGHNPVWQGEFGLRLVRSQGFGNLAGLGFQKTLEDARLGVKEGLSFAKFFP